MAQTYARRTEAPRPTLKPDTDRILEEGFVKRCPVCWRLWAASEFIQEDGVDRCPVCVDERTETWKAETLAEETAYAASREPMPQISQAKLAPTVLGSVTSMKDSSGNRVYGGAPLRLPRGVATTLLLYGVGFSSDDTITSDDLITVGVARTTTLTTLTLTADASLTPGDYGLVVNGETFCAHLRVR